MNNKQLSLYSSVQQIHPECVVRDRHRAYNSEHNRSFLHGADSLVKAAENKPNSNRRKGGEEKEHRSIREYNKGN